MCFIFTIAIAELRVGCCALTIPRKYNAVPAGIVVAGATVLLTSHQVIFFCNAGDFEISAGAHAAMKRRASRTRRTFGYFVFDHVKAVRVAVYHFLWAFIRAIGDLLIAQS